MVPLLTPGSGVRKGQVHVLTRNYGFPGLKRYVARSGATNTKVLPYFVIMKEHMSLFYYTNTEVTLCFVIMRQHVSYFDCANAKVVSSLAIMT